MEKERFSNIAFTVFPFQIALKFLVSNLLENKKNAIFSKKITKIIHEDFALVPELHNF